MFVLIVGGGRYGSALAAELVERRIEVGVIEKRAERLDELRAHLPKVTFVHGDGDEPLVLESAHISRAKIVVAAADEDEDNLVVCLLAKREYAVPHTVARVNSETNAWLFGGRFGVDEIAPAEPSDLAVRVAEMI